MEEHNKEQKIISLEILCFVKSSQQMHGLRHEDFQRYRGYCSRRIRRLRKALRIPQGDRRHFKKKDITPTLLEGKEIDVRYLHIPLMMAERAWAYAMQLRQESNTEPRKRFHVVSKLKKAVMYAFQLRQLCNLSVCDARSKLESEAYFAFMQGVLQFELASWTEAAKHFKEVQMVYETLIKTLPEEEQQVYKSKIDELSPSLRYCAYNIGGNAKMEDLIKIRGHGLFNDLDRLISQTKTQTLESLQTTEWRGRKITVRPEKVRLFLITLKNVKENLNTTIDNESKIEMIEKVLLDCKDALSALRDEIKQDPKLKGPSGESVGSAQYLMSYLSFTKIILTIERTMVLIVQLKSNIEEVEKPFEHKKAKPQDLSRLYEIILQNANELQQLQGMENDNTFLNEIEYLIQGFKAFKCYHIALTLLNVKRWKEAVAIYERSVKYAERALQSNCHRLIDLDQDLKVLINSIERSKYSAQAFSVLESDFGDEINLYGRNSKSSKFLYDTFLTEYKEDTTLNSKQPYVFKLPPEMEPVPCKPLFFDLAWNFVEFPSLKDQIQADDVKKGFSGLVKGFLGWGNN